MTEKRRAGTVALGWWRANIKADTGAARALSALLRRASGPAEILSHQAVFELAGSLQMRDPLRLALIAQTLAFVSEHTSRRLASVLGDGDPRTMSELRFQRLIRSPDLAQLGIALRRALVMVDGNCNVAALAEDLFHWGEKTRIRWCFEYFGANPPEESETKKNDKTAPEETEA